MLEEAVEVIRLLHEGGSRNHRGRHYTVENARIYTLPDEPVPIYVSAFGPKAVQLAAKIGDGFVCVMPDAELVRGYREAGGKGPAQGGFKVCHAPTAEEGLSTAHRIWPNEGLPGELAQVLPQPKHFEQASQLVTPDMLSLPVGPDPDAYVEHAKSFVDAGFDEVYVAQIGPRQEEFFQFWRDKVAPQLPR
jgi:G6PDH family F420-dependent oxidoreductase